MSKDYSDLSDEEFMKVEFPTEEEKGREPPEEKEGEEESSSTNSDDGVDASENEDDEITTEIEEDSPKSKENESLSEGDEDSEPKQTTDTPPDKQAEEVNYEDYYKKVFAPFKADGKTIQVKTPEEVISLMQKGAHYTRSMQQLAPHRKMIMMLENNGLLNEEKLSHLIDLDKKNPNAIKRLIKEAGIDPMDLESEIDPNIPQGNYTVSDNSVAFKSNIDDLMGFDEGKATIVEINNSWDEFSKKKLIEFPQLIKTIHAQRESGIYGKIVDEVERLRSVGEIPSSVGFIEAYKAVGDRLFLQPPQAQTTTQQPVPVARKTAVGTKKPDTNQERINAAATTRSVPKNTRMLPNYLDMSDDEIMKQK